MSVCWIQRCFLDEGQGGVGRQTLADNGQSDVELGDLPLHLDGFVLTGGRVEETLNKARAVELVRQHQHVGLILEQCAEL